MELFLSAIFTRFVLKRAVSCSNTLLPCSPFRSLRSFSSILDRLHVTPSPIEQGLLKSESDFFLHLQTYTPHIQKKQCRVSLGHNFPAVLCHLVGFIGGTRALTKGGDLKMLRVLYGHRIDLGCTGTCRVWRLNLKVIAVTARRENWNNSSFQSCHYHWHCNDKV